LDRTDRIELAISTLLKLGLAGGIVVGLLTGQHSAAFLALIGLVAALFPAMLERRMHLILPAEIDLTVTLFVYLSIFLGSARDLYDRIWWWDLFVHANSGLLVGLLGFIWAFLLFYFNRVRARPGFVLLFAVALAMLVGSVWEILEYALDQLLGWNMQRSGLVDTMWDLIADLVGALTAAVIGSIYLRTFRHGIIQRVLTRILRADRLA
jgi:hypothetical protein